MATFNAREYARKHGIGKTKIKSEHGVTTIPGLATTQTVKDITALAVKAVKEGGAVSHKFPPVDVEGLEVLEPTKFVNAKSAEGWVNGIFQTEETKVKVA